MWPPFCLTTSCKRTLEIVTTFRHKSSESARHNITMWTLSCATFPGLRRQIQLIRRYVSGAGSTNVFRFAPTTKYWPNYFHCFWTQTGKLKTNAAIWFNKVCKIKHIKPNYIHFRSSSQSVLPYTHHWLKNYAAKHRLTFWSRNFTFKF